MPDQFDSSIDVSDHARALIAAHGPRSVSYIVDLIRVAVRAGDDDRAGRLDRVLRQVEHQQSPRRPVPFEGIGAA